jgi:LPS-assembly protein
VTSRLLDPETGAERLRVGIGQLFYFYDQQVTLGQPPQKADPRTSCWRRRAAFGHWA